jgi:hypothetical protein
MTVSAFKTRALFESKIGNISQKTAATAKEAPEPAPGRT